MLAECLRHGVSVIVSLTQTFLANDQVCAAPSPTWHVTMLSQSDSRMDPAVKSVMAGTRPEAERVLDSGFFEVFAADNHQAGAHKVVLYSLWENSQACSSLKIWKNLNVWSRPALKMPVPFSP